MQRIAANRVAGKMSASRAGDGVAWQVRKNGCEPPAVAPCE